MLTVIAAAAGMASAQFPERQLTVQHPAIGSWFGEAVESCAAGDKTCPQAALLMTPTMTADGAFLGNDSFALGGPPFGPHTTAHGHWIATSGTDIIADYVFMLNGSTAGTIDALRFRWQASVISTDTMVGYVNIFFGPDIPIAWTNLGSGVFPTLPAQTASALTPPTIFYTDPAACPGGPPACPLIFKFTIKRVSQ